MMERCRDKVVFITGAGRGMGRSHALRFAEEGADLVLVDRATVNDGLKYPLASAADLEETAEQARALGAKVVSAVADVRNPDDLRDAVENGVSQLGRIDVLCANAGVAVSGPLLETTSEEWDSVISVNLTGAWQTVKAVTPAILEGGKGGSVILMSSGSGLRGTPGLGAYAASKHGVIGLMRTLAIELGPHDIRVNAVCPGNVNTPMSMNPAVFKSIRPDLENPGLEDVSEAFSSFHLLGVPYVESSDVSNALIWLASDEARYVTGVALPVDAGFVAR